MTGMFESLPLEQLIGKSFPCECGKTHTMTLKYLKIERGALKYVPEALRTVGGSHPAVVFDKNTYEAAGKRVCAILDEAGIAYQPILLPGEGRIEPDERAVGSVVMALDPACDTLIAVGSGVINDVVKVTSRATGKPNIIVGTAPSMDGFASNSSSMIVNRVKTTLYNHCPHAIVLDTEVLAAAPMRMIRSGLGDMVAKAIAVCEWRISKIVTGEYYCEHVAQLMRNALDGILAVAEQLPERDPDAIGKVAEGLVLSGIAMAYAQVSRPASGLEHYFSHMWEMMALLRGGESDFHGIQVGVGSLITLRIYDKLLTETPDREKSEAVSASFDEAKWRENIGRVFGKCAGEIFRIEEKAGKNKNETREKHFERIAENWDEIKTIIREELACAGRIREVMEKTGLPLKPSEIGVENGDVSDAFICSRDLRDKYLTSSMLWDMGLLETYEHSDLFSDEKL